MNICISREFGSGGHDIGEQIARRTGYRFLDRKLLEEAAERSGIAVEHLEKEDEKKANPWLHNVWYKSEDESLRGLSANDILFRVQSRYILECAVTGDNVFVGRCADYVLQKAEIPHVSIFITAPFESGVASLTDGAAELDNGAAELKDGTAEFRSETADIDSEIEDEIDQMIEEFSGKDYVPPSFVSDLNTNVEAVQFAFQTDPISVEEENVEEAEEEQENFWDKVKGLFE